MRASAKGGWGYIIDFEEVVSREVKGEVRGGKSLGLCLIGRLGFEGAKRLRRNLMRDEEHDNNRQHCAGLAGHRSGTSCRA